MNNRLEQYLIETEQKLQSLPPPRRQEEMDEMRQHLFALVQAGEKRGLTTDAATKQALEQFGQARQVGAELRRAWWREQTGSSFALPKAIVVAVALTYALHGILSPLTRVTECSLFPGASSQSIGLRLFLAGGLLLAIPNVIAGMILARLTPRNAILASVLAATVTFLVEWLNFGVLAVLSPNPAQFSTWNLLSTLTKTPLQALGLVVGAWLAVWHARSQRKEASAYLS